MAACERQQSLFGHAEDHTANVGPILCAGAHGAGLDCGDKGALPQVIRAVFFGCGANQGSLRMVDGVDVALAHEHRLAVGGDEQGRKGVMALLHGLQGSMVRLAKCCDGLLSCHGVEV
jgi:hypothetical protein